MNQSRIPTLLVLSLLIFSQSSTLFLASANGQAGTINLFSGNSASFSLSLTANHLDTNYSIDVPRNVTFQSGQFAINVKANVDSPGQVSLDIGQDGVNEWAFNEQGFGDLGHQNTFFNNMSSQSIFSTGLSQSVPFLLPHNSLVESGTMNATFTSDVAAGLIPIDNILTYESGDIDNDTRDEIVVKALVNLQSGPALSTLDWTSSTGITSSSWVATCGADGDIVLADVNGDNFSDVLSIAPDDDRVCFHPTNPANGTLGAAVSVLLSADLITASAGDINGDGYADILSIHEGGTVSLRTYNDKNSNFDENTTLTIYGNGSIVPAQLTTLYAGYFNGSQGEFSA
ncbi:MAG: VCBS repeat-containing protein, partial [Candidatus Poseidoniaceae archaeon]|nr:VCBS repeat-containing protein [Candidatus Poseidoniaceae archaeon]